jgi:hypothetical protein
MVDYRKTIQILDRFLSVITDLDMVDRITAFHIYESVSVDANIHLNERSNMWK